MKTSINIEFCLPHEMRYISIGDWWWDDDDTLQIRAVHRKCETIEQHNKENNYAWCVVLHELLEVLACRINGVDGNAVDKFDDDYEQGRKPSDLDSEPGDEPTAPYYEEHVAASIAERLFAAVLGVNWNEYQRWDQEVFAAVQKAQAERAVTSA